MMKVKTWYFLIVRTFATYLGIVFNFSFSFLILGRQRFCERNQYQGEG